MRPRLTAFSSCHPLVAVTRSPARLLSSSASAPQSRMALHPPHDKLIFAPSTGPSPSPSPGPGQAAQFLKHEPEGGLRRAHLRPADPIGQFHAWFADAGAAGVAHPETTTLSTAALPSGRVSARVVYLKELDPFGFIVYSNFGTSRKGEDLFGRGGNGDSDGVVPEGGGNPWAALTFWWEPLERQVRVEGRTARLSREESQVYFDTRARGSRIGAWASRQSAVLEPVPNASTSSSSSGGGGDGGGRVEDRGRDDGRAQLEQWVREAEGRFEGVEQIPCPEFWGGLRIVPERVEFWQGRSSRLHDRFVYDRVRREGEEDTWTLKRLSP